MQCCPPAAACYVVRSLSFQPSLVVGSEVHIIDFGLAKRYRNKRQHIPFSSPAAVKGCGADSLMTCSPGIFRHQLCVVHCIAGQRKSLTGTARYAPDPVSLRNASFFFCPSGGVAHMNRCILAGFCRLFFFISAFMAPCADLHTQASINAHKGAEQSRRDDLEEPKSSKSHRHGHCWTIPLTGLGLHPALFQPGAASLAGPAGAACRAHLSRVRFRRARQSRRRPRSRNTRSSDCTLAALAALAGVRGRAQGVRRAERVRSLSRVSKENSGKEAEYSC